MCADGGSAVKMFFGALVMAVKPAGTTGQFFIAFDHESMITQRAEAILRHG